MLFKESSNPLQVQFTMSTPSLALEGDLTLSDLIDLITSKSTVDVNKLAVKTNQYTLVLEVQHQDEPLAGQTLVLEETSANLLGKLQGEKRRRKMAETLLKQKSMVAAGERAALEPSFTKEREHAALERLSGINTSQVKKEAEINSRINFLERKNHKLSVALEHVKAEREKSEMLSAFRLRDLTNLDREIETQCMRGEDIYTSYELMSTHLSKSVASLEQDCERKDQLLRQREEELSDLRSKRNLILKKLTTTESLAAKELGRIKKKCDAGIKSLEAAVEKAQDEVERWRAAVGRLLQTVNEERAETHARETEEVDERDRQREQEEAAKGNISISMGICR